MDNTVKAFVVRALYKGPHLLHGWDETVLASTDDRAEALAWLDKPMRAGQTRWAIYFYGDGSGRRVASVTRTRTSRTRRVEPWLEV